MGLTVRGFWNSFRSVRSAPTPTQRLADVLLGGEGALGEFVRSRRDAGRSWRLIARDLYEVTDRQVDVTHESLRAWFPDNATAEVAS